MLAYRVVVALFTQDLLGKIMIIAHFFITGMSPLFGFMLIHIFWRTIMTLSKLTTIPNDVATSIIDLNSGQITELQTALVKLGVVG